MLDDARAAEENLSSGGGNAAGQHPSGHSVDISSVTHRFGSFLAVDNVSLSVAAGEILALLGPSGCGKTTLLRVLSGFVQQSAGSVLVDGRPIDHLPPNMRSVGIVFQSYALFPHMTVGENVAYGLRARGRPTSEIRPKVEALLDVVQLGGMLDRLPRALSGGQQQRVALARALAIEPSVLLLDEPFSALDKSLRLDMQLELKRLQRQFGLTAILVTHDQDEAMSVADRIAVMNKGRVEQVDTPVNVYDRPQTRFVSGFIGTTNELVGTVETVAASGVRIRLAAGATITLSTRQTLAPGDRVVVTARPEQLAIDDAPGDGRWPVDRRLSIPIGAQAIHELRTRDGSALKVIEPRVGSIGDTAGAAWCGLRADAEPAVFPISP